MVAFQEIFQAGDAPQRSERLQPSLERNPETETQTETQTQAEAPTQAQTVMQAPAQAQPELGPTLIDFSVEHPSHAQLAAAEEAVVRIEERARRLASGAAISAGSPATRPGLQDGGRGDYKGGGHRETDGETDRGTPAAAALQPPQTSESDEDTESDVSSGVD